MSVFFCLTVPINFVGEPFCVAEKFGYRKTLCTSTMSRFSVAIFLSHSAKKSRGGTVQSFRNFRVSKNLKHKKGISLVVSVEFFVSKCPKTSLGKPVYQNCSDNKNFLDKRGIRILTIFCNQCPKTSRRNPSGFQKYSDSGNFLDNRRIKILPIFFSSDSAHELRGGTLLCFRKFLVSKNFMDRKGRGRDFHNIPSNICCVTVPKNFEDEPFCVSEMFWYQKFFG